MWVDEVHGYDIWKHRDEWEVTDPIGRGYGFPAEQEAREWATHQASIQGWR